MPNQPCPNPFSGSKIIAQTLFLGSSVNSFNTSMGWGGQPSQLTVTLVDDIANSGCLINGNTIAEQLPAEIRSNGNLIAAVDNNDVTGGRFTADHYHQCIGDSCYVNIKGETFDSSKMTDSDKMVPGKVYYAFCNTMPDGRSSVFQSSYWYNPDPGFFGKPNRIRPDNSYIKHWQRDNSNLNNGYDIIDTPVLFKFGNFTFGGLVQSWTEQLGQSGRIYTVTVNSMQSLLNSCYIIVGGYAGAVYSKLARSTAGSLGAANNSIYGGPRNYTGKTGVDYFGAIYEGNLPNVFNVYGFLESFGLDGFGASKLTEDGISANDIIDALIVLTSSTSSGQALNSTTTTPNGNGNYAPKSAFSPYGRILTKCMQELDTYNPIQSSFRRFGVIPPENINSSVSPTSSTPRCSFMLDLSELPRFPKEYRISGPVITITELLNNLGEAGGFDYYTELLPIWNTDDSRVDYVIKIKTISRLSQPRPYEIQNTINSLKCNNYPVSSITIGQEKNETAARQVIIGGPVQRLYQAKSYRLAYTQSNFIYDPYKKIFINYMQLGSLGDTNFLSSNVSLQQFFHGKTKTPSYLSLHNPLLSSIINPAFSGLYEHNDSINSSNTAVTQNSSSNSVAGNFSSIDEIWNDANQLKTGISGKSKGNYLPTELHKPTFDSSNISTWGATISQRFFPLYKDVISPFFGFVMDNSLDIKTDGSNNDFRRIRPVWFDTWTGQIVILIRRDELPDTSIKLTSNMKFSGIDYFILTESEIRSAIQGFDEFLVYCLSKTYKNELVEMLRRSYILKDIDRYKRENPNISDDEAKALANKKHDWYWRLMGGSISRPGSNIAGPFNLTNAPAPDKFDNTNNIDQAALRDLQILHKFVQSIGDYYGRKYMVIAPYLASYKDEEFSNIVLPTQAGSAYVFNGGGSLHYSYEPTNDGAWEEYGSIIDDCIAVGGKEWYNLTDDVGKIKPLLGYNANDSFDIASYNMCQQNASMLSSLGDSRLNPFWNYDLWDNLKEKYYTSCDSKNFVYPTLNYSQLSGEDYQLVSVSGTQGSLPSIYNQFNQPNPAALSSFVYSWTASTARDPFGTELSGSGLGMKKLFMNASVDEKIVFLDPSGLKEPRILISPPQPLFLNSSSNLYSQDPNSSIVANVAMEDLLIYLRSTQNPSNRDYNWINYMLSYVYSVLNDKSFYAGGASSNKSSSYASLSPKAAHPFFAGIPIKSNVYNYGPWSNYPYIDYLYNPEDVFPSGQKITPSGDNYELPVVCSTGFITIDAQAAQKAVNNWILPTKIDVISDYVPWNFGGMAFLDSIAINEVRSNTNYQNILETAQIDMPGLPLFNLGGSFTYGSYCSLPTGTSSVNISGYPYTDIKYQTNSAAAVLADFQIPNLINPLAPSTEVSNVTYNTLWVSGVKNNFGGPVVTNIQVNTSQGGITTTYSFRTYTKKLGLFNKENSDNFKKIYLNNLKRNKQLSKMDSQFRNILYKQNRTLINQQSDTIGFGAKDFRSKLYGWSPVKVLIAQASPYIPPLVKTPDPYSSYSQSYAGSGNGITSAILDKPTSFNIKYGNNIGDDIKTWVSSGNYLDTQCTLPALASAIRYRTDVGIFEEKEVNAQMNRDYGLQSMMSLDGIFSPVSFYPTMKNSTFHFGLYTRQYCPFCKGTKKITAKYLKYLSTGYDNVGVQTIDIYCDKCAEPSETLNVKLKSSTTSKSTGQSLETLPPYIVTSGTDINALSEYIKNQNTSSTQSSSNSSSNNSGGQAGINIPINLVSLQPIVVPYGEFKNPNIQNYIGTHPEGEHNDLSIGAFNAQKPRTFIDRCRHSIEVVARGSINPDSINISNGLKEFEKYNNELINADYYDKDLKLYNALLQRDPNNVRLYQNNQRFLGLRGPLVMHAWGYDSEGYPVPNAADEPYEIDQYNRPKRFKIKIKDGYPKDVKYETLNKGDIYTYNNNEYIAKINDAMIGNPPAVIGPSVSVKLYIYEDDLTNPGGFDSPNVQPVLGQIGPVVIDRTAGFQGNIISKTQKWTPNDPANPNGPGKWTDKKKLKEFYLNWAERPDLWPVGPIDLRWDNDRRVWTINSNAVSSIYKMVYVTLEEDLIRDEDSDDTYPTRGFLDDLEYSTQPLDKGLRRLIFVKDSSGFSAPRGAKILCRYNKDTGFYEPVSKPSFVVKGTILSSSNTAVLEMSYIAGKKRGEPYPTMIVQFENLFDLPITQNKGLFTFLNSRWILTTSK